MRLLGQLSTGGLRDPKPYQKHCDNATQNYLSGPRLHNANGEHLSFTFNHVIALDGNLMAIFNQRSPEARMEAMKKYDADDIIFYQPHSITRGYEAVSGVAQDLLDKAPDWVFSPIGKVIANHDIVMLSWGFGPPGDVKVKGTDVMLVEISRIKVLCVVIEAGWR
jgi:hypothetical protein